MRRRAWITWMALAFVMYAGLVPARAQEPRPTDPPPDPTAEFFNDAVVHEIRLTLNPKDWDQLKREFQQNTYYPTTLKWRDQTVKNVGIRSRGTGSRSDRKPALRVDSDRYTAKQRFLGLKSFVLRNNIQDPTMLHERVAMKFFERMNIPAPREAHARLFVNDQYVGLYTIVESVDKDFLSRNYHENDGHLYEYEYDAEDEPYYFTDKGDDQGAYTPKPFKPATHEKDPDLAPVVALVKAINQTSRSEFRSRVAEFLDLDKFLTHVAVENFLGETDGILGNWAMNNFYFYRFERKSLSTFIPWDKSHTFTVGPDHSIWHNIDAPSWLRNRLMERCMEHPDLVDTYVNALSRAAEVASMPSGSDQEGEDQTLGGSKPAQKSWLETEIQYEFDQIREAALADQFKPDSNEDFEAAVQSLLHFARERANLVRIQVDRHFGNRR